MKIDYIRRAQKKEQPVGYSFRADCYDIFQVIYVSHGQLCIDTSGRHTGLLPGHVAILRHGSDFTLSCPEIPYSGVAFIAVTGNFPKEFYGRSEVLRASPTIINLAAIMETYFQAPCPESAAVQTGVGLAMAWEAIRLSADYAASQAESRSAKQWVQAARSLIDASLYNAKTATQALEPLSISYRHLSRYFHSVLGMSPKQYQLHSKLTEAEHLLAETALPVTTIAMELGFASSQYLATQFKKQYGATPTVYRKRKR